MLYGTINTEHVKQGSPLRTGGLLAFGIRYYFLEGLLSCPPFVGLVYLGPKAHVS